MNHFSRNLPYWNRRRIETPGASVRWTANGELQQLTDTLAGFTRPQSFFVTCWPNREVSTCILTTTLHTMQRSCWTKSSASTTSEMNSSGSEPPGTATHIKGITLMMSCSSTLEQSSTHGALPSCHTAKITSSLRSETLRKALVGDLVLATLWPVVSDGVNRARFGGELIRLSAVGIGN